MVRVQEQNRERRPLPRPAERNGSAVGEHLQRAQESEVEHLADRSRSITAG